MPRICYKDLRFIIYSNPIHQNWTYFSNCFQPSVYVKVTWGASKTSKGTSKPTNLTLKFRGIPGINPPCSNVKTKQNEKPKLAHGDSNFFEHFMKILRQIVKYISLISTINILYIWFSYPFSNLSYFWYIKSYYPNKYTSSFKTSAGISLIRMQYLFRVPFDS